MSTYLLRRVLLAIPTLLLISFVIFVLLDVAPGDPTSSLPLTIPDEVRENIRMALGLDQPFLIRYFKWLEQFFISEPLSALDAVFHLGWAEDRVRVVSFASRSPVFDLILQRLPQTLWVVGSAYLVGVLIAIPIGLLAAYRQYSWIDQLGSFIATIGFSVPTFFAGLLLIVIFSVKLGWLPSVYDTTLQVHDMTTFGDQVRQMILPVAVMGLHNAALIMRYMRASTLENLSQDYVRTARAKGLPEVVVVLRHVMRNSLIPVVTVVAVGIPTIFSGAIITEQIFRINGIGQLLISAIQSNDIPVVQTLAFIFAVLIVVFNIVADIAYGLLDPRIRYD